MRPLTGDRSSNRGRSSGTPIPALTWRPPYSRPRWIRADGDRPRTVLDYAREKLFDPLGIWKRRASPGRVPDPLITPGFVTADFGWGTDPNGIELGAYGLRLTPPDMLKIGELYRGGGVWNGQQIVPAAWIQQCTSPATYESQIGGPLEYGLLWWILTDRAQAGSKEPGAGWIFRGWVRWATHLRAAEIASSDRLHVGRATRKLFNLLPGSGAPQQRVRLSLPAMT